MVKGKNGKYVPKAKASKLEQAFARMTGVAALLYVLSYGVTK